MTASFWNKQQLQENFPHCRELSVIISQLESELLPKGQVICEMRINGVKLSEQDEVRFASMSTDEIHDLVVYSSSPAELVDQALTSALDYIPHLCRGCDRAGALFRNFQLDEGRTVIVDLIEGLQWLHDTVVHLRGTWAGLEAYQMEAAAWTKNQQAFQQGLRQMIEAFERTEYVALADALEFDLLSALQEWQRLLQNSQWTQSRSV